MSNTPNIKTSKQVVPMVYGYTTPEVERHNGWTKIGYTEQEVEIRIEQQCHTADIKWNLEWKKNAIFDDGSGEAFIDKDFHAYLRKAGIEQENGKNNEWFHITGPESKQMINDFRESHGLLGTEEIVIPYKLRDEQTQAVERTVAYRKANEGGKFLWNAKPRFGKTLSVYDFVKRIGAEKVLVVTNRPAIANSWFSDYCRFLGSESGYHFVSEVDALKGRRGVLTRAEFNKAIINSESKKLIEFVSLQDMKGAKVFGGQHEKLDEVAKLEWDLLVIDEAHEGVDTYRTDVAFEHINRKFTLHLSGTPFKALASGDFANDEIFNWTYADEQEKKRDWDNSDEQENPYATLPKLNLFTYQMSEIIKEELSQGIEIQGETEEYAFDLNEFFGTDNGRFIYDSSVDRFLDAMTTQEKFPFSTPELRAELKHTFWLLDRVDSAKALAKKLANHPVFKDYEVVLAAGDGKLDDNEETMKSYDKVCRAIKENDKTITLSVGQLTTGITIPEWTAVLMLSNVKSPALYMQAAFRAQNPCLFKEGTVSFRKENAYVFDFDPARTLTIYEQFANNLNPKTAKGGGTAEDRRENIRDLLNFFPVIGEDEEGKLVELDAEKVLTIPRKIRSVEVVKRGFMSNFLFQNVHNIFGAPREVIDILSKFEPIEEPKNKVNLSEETKKDLSLNENGEVELDEGMVIGRTQDIFGDKIYSDAETGINIEIERIRDAEQTHSEKLKDALKDLIKKQAQKGIIAPVQEKYGSDMKKSDARQITSRLNNDAERLVDREVANFNIEKNMIEQERKETLAEQLQHRNESGKTSAQIEKEVNELFDKKQEESKEAFQKNIESAINDFVKNGQREAVRTVETKKKEREKETIEDGIRNHLRGFSRTIPSFLMAYGDDSVTLATFDTKVPDKVFLEVTSITLDQFKFLRDGGDYTDEETGEQKHFDGQLFDSVVFDDSVKEFLLLKKKLADYFDESAIEDIFDYIPPQKTNQIFTPKMVVKKMVDMLEEENPGCFDQPDKTFVDLYMKSGLYIAEIVKRLYQSEEMKKLYPDKKDRLQHIFEEQVYGLAPTEIIYKIATSFILGFDEDVTIKKHNFRQVDALPFAKAGTLEQELDRIYGE